MLLKKINAGCSWLTTIFTSVHIVLSSLLMLNVHMNFKPIQRIAWITALVTFIHAVIGIIMVLKTVNLRKHKVYFKENIRTYLQRITGIVFIVLLVFHIIIFNKVFPLTYISPLNKAIIIIIEGLFFAVTIFHMAISFSRSLITFGFVSTDKSEKVVDFITYAFCFALFVFAMTSLLIYIINFGN